LVGDPLSLIFASYAGYEFNEFFVYKGRLSIFFVVQTGAIYFYLYFSKVNQTKLSIEPTTIVSLVPSILLVFLGLAIASFFHTGIALVSGILVMVLGLTGLLWYILIRKNGFPAGFKLVRGLDWETILFLVGIFISIGAVSEVGLLNDLVGFLHRIIGGNVLWGFVIINMVSILISGCVDSVPYIIAMLPVTGVIANTDSNQNSICLPC
jgi:Na+/H+ antiporter NhaD/arsenite permease-like protein